jgi:hypothetical protein
MKSAQNVGVGGLFRVGLGGGWEKTETHLVVIICENEVGRAGSGQNAVVCGLWYYRR